MSDVVILSAARTPIGRLSGILASRTATELGGRAIAGALDRAGLAGDDVDYVAMGQVIAAGAGQVPARQAAANGGVPMSVPSGLVNKACLSGMNTIYLALRMIEAGDAEVVVAGGMESMTNAPYLLRKARAGYRFGDDTIYDAMMLDGLFCAFDMCAMGAGTERDASEAGIARSRMDELAAASHERAARAQKDGLLAEEIVDVTIPQRRGEPVEVDTDEGIRPDSSTELLANLGPAFAEVGNITAGNSSQISDGAAAVVVTTKARAEGLGVEPLCEIIGSAQVAGPDTSLLHQPSRAALTALERADLTVADVDLFEINEAFAAVAAASIDDLGLADDLVNVNGGAIALGHPIGASGTRIVSTLAYELRRRGGGIGSASLCGGGGQGEALIVKV